MHDDLIARLGHPRPMVVMFDREDGVRVDLGIVERSGTMDVTYAVGGVDTCSVLASQPKLEDAWGIFVDVIRMYAPGASSARRNSIASHFPAAA